jgi:methyl-accepting chemotaxis protein
MYAQGMNSGQAVRSVLLDPADQASKAGLLAADHAFVKSLKQAMSMAEAGTPRAVLLAKVDAKWDALSQLREMYADIAGVNGNAKERFAQEEVPLWRDVSATPLQLRDQALQGTLTAKAEIKSRADRVLKATLVLIVLALVFSVVMTLYVLERVSKSLAFLDSSLSDMAEGGGNLRAELPVTGKCEIGRTSQAFNRFVAGLRELVHQARSNSDQVSQEIVRLSGSAEQVNTASQRQHEEATEAAEAVKQLSNSIGTVASFADSVRKLSEKSMNNTEASEKLLDELTREIGQVRAAMDNINQSVSQFLVKTDEISAMTQLVQDIAEQTNLLALNAAIEAARAGEHGRGFAVVADEVRKLAEKSARSAQNIDAITQSLDGHSKQMNQAVQQGGDAIKTSDGVLGKVMVALQDTRQAALESGQGVAGIASSVAEHEASSQAIVRNVERIAQMAQENLQSVVKTSKAVRQISDLARQTTLTFAKFQT